MNLAELTTEVAVLKADMENMKSSISKLEALFQQIMERVSILDRKIAYAAGAVMMFQLILGIALKFIVPQIK